MENKFKPGDKVIFEREPTDSEWEGIGEVNHNLKIGEVYTIKEVFFSSNKYRKECIKIEEDALYKYSISPNAFKLLDNSYLLKQELKKLKETILSGRFIKLTKKDRRIFESLCKKFEIDIPEGNRLASLEYPIVYARYRLGYTGQKDLCFFIKMADNDIAINFKDLIEPFKKFRDEVL